MFFRPSATVSRIGLMESRVHHHRCHGGPPPGWLTPPTTTPPDGVAGWGGRPRRWLSVRGACWSSFYWWGLQVSHWCLFILTYFAEVPLAHEGWDRHQWKPIDDGKTEVTDGHINYEHVWRCPQRLRSEKKHQKTNIWSEFWTTPNGVQPLVGRDFVTLFPSVKMAIILRVCEWITYVTKNQMTRKFPMAPRIPTMAMYTPSK